MRRMVVGLFAVGACHDASPRVEIAAPYASAPLATVAEPLPSFAAAIVSKHGGAWARSFPKDKTFKTYEVGEAARAVLTWRVGRSHFVERVKGGDESREYPVNYSVGVDLVVRARGQETNVSLGDLPGWINTYDASYCKNRGFRTGTTSRWGFPTEPSLAAAFGVGIPQGGDDFIVVRDGATLHVLHRDTDAGDCDDAKQGPLDICEGREYARVAEVHGGLTTSLFELVEEDGKPFDCAGEHHGQHLLPP